MTRLSDVPLSELRTDEGWLISATGTRGKITAITSTTSGNQFKTRLRITWDNGLESYAKWPHECNNIQVDDRYQHILCKPYVNARVEELLANVDYLKQFEAE
ncbi:hypothetical protein ST201phi2-1p102 [Pseudomonas phage 201phi2-1]|uniref:Uncharacterized protein n=1 Tax=Pseudomonas phage 201phi2-1 TaxID=198110 RepID=B3FIW6_BP201|nr:hypothetical protein ST201phi2-1p102 [Pseudomonas phage 201phi2-1]ABY62935.1 hypothetical protein 201phi2-1p102 [Pseudomonas phage 201phi2-1]